MTHTHFHCLKPILCCSKKKQLNCHRAIQRPQTSQFYFWEKCCEWNVDRETSVIPIPSAITTLSADIQFQPQLYSQCSFPPALLNTFTLPVSWPSVSWLPHWSLWQLAGNGWPQLASDQALWPAGQLSGAAGIQCTVFWGKSVNILSTGEDCLQNPVASRFGARLAEAKNRQT